MLETATLQLIAYATLTFMGICIAGGALFFSYRQNFGWKPVVLVTKQGVADTANNEVAEALVSFEVWNRRKYPIVVTGVGARFLTLEMLSISDIHDEDLQWVTFENEACGWGRFSLDSSKHRAISVSMLLNKKSFARSERRLKIDVQYFDPIKNRYDNVVSEIEFLKLRRKDKPAP